MEGYVLVVDDDPDARGILCQILDSVGLSARQAADGQEALEHIRREAPRLILLDLMMPRMNGFAVIAYVQSNPSIRSVPIVVVSAFDFGEKEMLRLPGVSGVVQKANFHIIEMRDMIVSVLERKRTGLPHSA
jgi:CheY-like chemotaxis protein